MKQEQLWPSEGQEKDSSNKEKDGIINKTKQELEILFREMWVNSQELDSLWYDYNDIINWKLSPDLLNNMLERAVVLKWEEKNF